MRSKNCSFSAIFETNFVKFGIIFQFNLQYSSKFNEFVDRNDVLGLLYHSLDTNYHIFSLCSLYEVTTVVCLLLENRPRGVFSALMWMWKNGTFKNTPRGLFTRKPGMLISGFIFGRRNNGMDSCTSIAGNFKRVFCNAGDASKWAR